MAANATLAGAAAAVGVAGQFPLGAVPSFGSAVKFLLTGTFNTIALYTLAFDPLARTLTVAGKTDAQGPHQYLCSNAARDRVYATTWAWPPTLSSWAVEQAAPDAAPVLRLVNNANITATSSYVFATDRAIYSAGGPTGEVHAIDETTGGFGKKLQELIYVPEDQLEQADKTRKALRYGSHGVDLSSQGQAFVPDLGGNSIWMYSVNEPEGTLKFLSENKSPRPHDAPRHNVPSKDGKLVYAVTEHTSFVDVYEVLPTSLKWRQSASIIPIGRDPHSFRGDTLKLSLSGTHLFASTRGGSPSTRGFVSAWKLDSEGYLESYHPTATYETPTSGGKANAIEVAPFAGEVQKIEYISLTDDEQGLILILGWDGERFEEIARTQLAEGAMASHLIWLSGA